MSDPYDPYHELLGIEKSLSQPDHYALLGLKRFESDPDAIEEAATQRMSALQEIAAGELMDDSQKLLNELSAARRCLLNPVEKVAYDEALRSRDQRNRNTTPGTTRLQKKAAQQKQQRKMFAGATVIVLLIGAFTLFSGPKEEDLTNLILDWTLEERFASELLVDSKVTELPNVNPVRLTLPLGRRTIVMKRAGFKDIEHSMYISRIPRKIKLQWVPER